MSKIKYTFERNGVRYICVEKPCAPRANTCAGCAFDSVKSCLPAITPGAPTPDDCLARASILKVKKVELI